MALAVSVLTAASALASDKASDKADIMAVLNQWNGTDEAKAVASCADDAAVIDDIPPYEWHGPSACSRWQKDYDAYAQKEGITDAIGTIGPRGRGRLNRLVRIGPRGGCARPATAMGRWPALPNPKCS